ncbi:hypothetical protein [Reyranella sp.]|uniref:hypothetical protein n=1 Tax=Reyranella sp. TaxID=1929291 RepID=UPI003BADA119
MTSTDSMMVDYDPCGLALGRVANHVITRCGGINRVTVNIPPKPPGAIERE